MGNNLEKETNLKNIKFLDDSPVFEDELKLHKNIANTIKRILELTKGRNKKIIGLFGSWGSGKSTVIEILKKEIGEKNVFIFDSWSHKGDFLKRAFLLELAKSLGVEKEKYTKNNNEKNTKNNNEDEITIETVLTRKIINKIVDSESSSNLSVYIKILTGLLLLSIFAVSFSKIINYLFVLWIPIGEIFKLDFFEKYKWMIEAGVYTFFLIFFIFLLWKQLTNFINFYFLKKVNITESHTTKEDLEFTNYDYENYLKYILGKANLEENEPFIIVFDNLDRIDNESVLNTLSLIQLTNEVLEKTNKLKNFKNVYFLIPIDKERLIKTIKTIIAIDSNNETEQEKFAEDFIEKIFPYKVNIPNIEHSNWRKFFKDKIKEAFGSEITKNENDIFTIIRIFEKSISKSEKKNLTPREIKNFINSLVENYLYWENSEERIDIKLQALYVSLYNYFTEELKNYLEPTNSEYNNIKDILKITEEEFSKKEIKEALLKQYYKVEEIYVLFIEHAIKAIKEEKIYDLQTIVNLFEDKYKVKRLLEEVLDKEDEFKNNINLILKFYKAIKEINFYNNIYEYGIKTTLKRLINNIETLSKLDEKHIDEFSEILKVDKDIKKHFIQKSIEIIKTIPKEEDDEKKG